MIQQIICRKSARCNFLHFLANYTYAIKKHAELCVVNIFMHAFEYIVPVQVWAFHTKYRWGSSKKMIVYPSLSLCLSVCARSVLCCWCCFWCLSPSASNPRPIHRAVWASACVCHTRTRQGLNVNCFMMMSLNISIPHVYTTLTHKHGQKPVNRIPSKPASHPSIASIDRK